MLPHKLLSSSSLLRLKLILETSCNNFNKTTVEFHTSKFLRQKMGKRALVIICKDNEELEVVTPINTLRRAGVDVTVAGLDGDDCLVLSRGVIVKPEVTLKEALKSAPYDAVILPGGRQGSEYFIESDVIGEILKDQEKGGRLVAAICAAPRALHRNNVFLGRAVTTYPLSKDRMSAEGKYIYKEDRVVVDGNLITSRGPGTALEWSLAILEWLMGKEKAKEIADLMLAK